MSNSESCQEADGLFGEHEGERNLTGIGFASREMAGTYLYFFAEEAPSEWWTPSYSESVAAYYASSAWGRCYADWLEDNQKSSAASVAELQVKASAIAPADGASVAWNYHLEGKPTELRVEVYVWTEGPLMLLVQVFTSEGDLDPDFTATMLSMYRDRATTEIAESR